MDLKDLEKINSKRGILEIVTENQKTQREAVRKSAQSTLIADNNAAKVHHQVIRDKVDKIVREEKQIELLAKILQSSKDADNKSDLMLFVVIITGGMTFFELVFN